MQVTRYYAGFDFADIGTLTLSIANDDDGQDYSVSLTSGAYFHCFDDTSHDGEHDDLAGDLQAELNAAASAATSTVTWVVGWHNDLMAYSFTPSVGTFDFTANAVAQTTLGLAGSGTGLAQLLGQNRPYYVIEPFISGVSQWPGDRHIRGQVRGGYTGSGRAFGSGPTTLVKESRWVQEFEPRSAVYYEDSLTTGGGYAGAGTIPWTWLRFFEHCAGYSQPFVLCTSVLETVLYSSSYAVGRFYLMPGENLADPQPAFSAPGPSTLKYHIPVNALVHHRF